MNIEDWIRGLLGLSSDDIIKVIMEERYKPLLDPLLYLQESMKKGRIDLYGQATKSVDEKGDRKNGRLEFIEKWEEFDGKKWVEKSRPVEAKR